MRPPPPHGGPATRAITLELVRVTLGGRGAPRPELEAPVVDDRTQHRHRPRRPRR